MMASDDQHPPQQVQQLRRELQEEQQQQDQKMGPLLVTFPRPVPKVQSLKLEPEKGQEEPQSRSMVQVLWRFPLSTICFVYSFSLSTDFGCMRFRILATLLQTHGTIENKSQAIMEKLQLIEE
jgi:hypothetical protein